MHCVSVISTWQGQPHLPHPPTLGHTLSHWGTPSHTVVHPSSLGTPSYTGAHPPTLGHTLPHWYTHPSTLVHTIPHWGTPSHTGAHPPSLVHTLPHRGTPYSHGTSPGVTFFVRFPSFLYVSQQGIWTDCTTFYIESPENFLSLALLTVVNGKVVLSVQADQHYHTKVTGMVWCIENMTTVLFAIKFLLLFLLHPLIFLIAH